MITLHFLHELVLVTGAAALLIVAAAIVVKLRRKEKVFIRPLLIMFTGILVIVMGELFHGGSSGLAAEPFGITGIVLINVGGFWQRRQGSLWQS